MLCDDLRKLLTLMSILRSAANSGATPTAGPLERLVQLKAAPIMDRYSFTFPPVLAYLGYHLGHLWT